MNCQKPFCHELPSKLCRNDGGRGEEQGGKGGRGGGREEGESDHGRPLVENTRFLLPSESSRYSGLALMASHSILGPSSPPSTSRGPTSCHLLTCLPKFSLF